jgi:NADH-quinone oxidoreductase subunit A
MFEVYFPMFLLIFVVIAMAVAMVLLSYLFGKRIREKTKLSTYECGNEPFEDARGRFSVKFYLIAILFMIEMGIFLLILLAGYFYIIKKGALKWEESEEIT